MLVRQPHPHYYNCTECFALCYIQSSMEVLEISNQPLHQPKIPSIVRELQKEFEEHRKTEDKKRRGLKTTRKGTAALCELCDGSYSDPVTYHITAVATVTSQPATKTSPTVVAKATNMFATIRVSLLQGGNTWYLMCKDYHKNTLQ